MWVSGRNEDFEPNKMEIWSLFIFNWKMIAPDVIQISGEPGCFSGGGYEKSRCGLSCQQIEPQVSVSSLNF